MDDNAQDFQNLVTLDDPNNNQNAGNSATYSSNINGLGGGEHFPFNSKNETKSIDLEDNANELFIPLEQVAHNEKIPTIEKLSSEKPVEEKKDTPQETINQTAPTNQTTPHVVDKTAEATPVHHIEHPHDSLTSLADAKEEKFITEVKHAHEKH